MPGMYLTSWKKNSTAHFIVQHEQKKNQALNIVNARWSKRRDPESANCIHFAEQCSVSLDMWTKAYHWALGNKKILQRSQRDGSTLYFTTSAEMNKPITSKILQKCDSLQGRWSSLDEFRIWNYGIWIIRISAANLNESTCTCPFFYEKSAVQTLLGTADPIEVREHTSQKLVICLSGRTITNQTCFINSMILFFFFY